MVSIILHMLIILSIVCIVLLLVVCAHVGSVILNIRGYELWKMLRCGCFVKKSFWYYTNRHMNSAQVDSYRDSCPQTANTPNILGLYWRLTRARCSLMSDFSHLLLVLNSSVNIIIYGWKVVLEKVPSEGSQSRRRPLLGPSPGWKRLLLLSHLRHY